MEACETCRFWGGKRQRRHGTDPEAGLCRRYPPTVHRGATRDMTAQPLTWSYQWCGEWREVAMKGAAPEDLKHRGERF